MLGRDRSTGNQNFVAFERNLRIKLDILIGQAVHFTSPPLSARVHFHPSRRYVFMSRYYDDLSSTARGIAAASDRQERVEIQRIARP
jgi:hypothetical protein